MSLLSRNLFTQWKHVPQLFPKFYGDTKHSNDRINKVAAIGPVSALKGNSVGGGWAKNSLREFAEKMLVLRFEYLLEKTTYMEDLRKSKAHVLLIQKKLSKAGEKKRHVMKDLEVVRNDLNYIYKDLNIVRIKKLHIDFACKEIQDLCKVEQHLWDMYNQIDKEEHCLMSEIVVAITEANEKEKNHCNFIKVVSIVVTVIGSIFALILNTFVQWEHHKVLENKISRLMGEPHRESWGSYLKRNTRWIYSWSDKFR